MSCHLAPGCCKTVEDCGVGLSQSEVDGCELVVVCIELQRFHEQNMEYTYNDKGCFMQRHDVMALSSALEDTRILHKSANTTFFLEEAF